jgi:hypothetical protein
MKKQGTKSIYVIAVLLIIAGIAAMICGCASSADTGTSGDVASGSAPADSGSASGDAPDDAEKVTAGLADIPETFAQDELVLADGKLKVRIDAEVARPDTDVLSLAKLTPKTVDAETKEKWLDFLSDGKPLYYARSYEEYLSGQVYRPVDNKDYTKREIEEIIKYLKSGNYLEYYEEGADPWDLEYSEAWGVANDIAGFEALYDSAPETVDRDAYDKADQSDIVILEADLGRVRPAIIGITAKDGSENFSVPLFFENVNTRPPSGSVIQIEEGDETGPDMPFEEALKIAGQYVEGLGFTDFQLSNAGLTPDSDRTMLEVDAASYDDLPKCYVFYFTKTVGGLNETFVERTYRDGENLAEMPEYVEVKVSDAGVLSLSYNNGPVETEITESIPEIVSFGEAVDRFSDEVAAHGVRTGWPEDWENDIVERRITIDRIELGGMRILDGNGAYVYTPVWSFFGGATEKYAPGKGDTNQQDENNEFHYTDLAQCILTINAIDGSVVDRWTFDRWAVSPEEGPGAI